MSKINDGICFVCGIDGAESGFCDVHSGYRPLYESDGDGVPLPKMVGCYDCARPYGDEHGFPDLLIPHAAWAKISPTGDEGGLLCPSCIAKRCHAAGLENVPATFASGPLCLVAYDEFDPPTPQHGGESE